MNCVCAVYVWSEEEALLQKQNTLWTYIHTMTDLWNVTTWIQHTYEREKKFGTFKMFQLFNDRWRCLKWVGFLSPDLENEIRWSINMNQMWFGQIKRFALILIWATKKFFSIVQRAVVKCQSYYWVDFLNSPSRK